MLEHEPHTLHIVFRMSPVSFRIEISDIESISEPKVNLCYRSCDLACDECLTTNRRFMIEEESIHSEHPIAFSVIHRRPIGEELCDTIGTARMEWRSFIVSLFWHIIPDTSEHL